MNRDSYETVTPPPPEAWNPARRVAMSVKGPIERFMQIEAGSGIALLAAAVIALVWANSPWSESYDALWHTPVSVGFGPFALEESLHFWINDLLMTVFFLVVGLEIKREISEGALSEWRRAALPLAAALGGMLIPALLFLSMNLTGPGQRGWGVPMATDIAFAVGVLTLLGKRVPAGLRVLLLAIAIIDDIGAIIVIAVFYSTGFDPAGLVTGGGAILGMIILKSIGVRNPWIYVVPGLVLCGGLMQLGVHPTIAGVIAGLLTPARSWFGREGFLSAARAAIEEFSERAEQPDHDEHELVEPLSKLARARREALSPARRVEAALHPWVAFGIMPIFALANAGVHLGGVSFETIGAGGRRGRCAVRDCARVGGRQTTRHSTHELAQREDEDLRPPTRRHMDRFVRHRICWWHRIHDGDLHHRVGVPRFAASRGRKTRGVDRHRHRRSHGVWNGLVTPIAGAA